MNAVASYLRRHRVRLTMRVLFAAALLAFAPLTTFAREAAPAADDPVLEQRLMTLAGELRCLVCQNQTLAESQAELALDMKNEIRAQMRRGASDQDVIDFLLARYGDFVLFRPPFKATTLLLWSGPAILLLLGFGILIRTLRRRGVQIDQSPPSDAARARARELLGANGTEEAS